MSLVLKKSTTQKKDGTEVYIDIVTPTGVYDVDDNDGGFGAPNPARNSLALLFYGLIEKSADSAVLVPESHDPLTVESFTFLLDGNDDGVWHFWVYALPIFDGMGTYSDGDVVYDNEDPVNPFIKKMVSASWVTISIFDLILETTPDFLEEHDFIIPTASDFVSDLNRDQLDLLRRVRTGTSGTDDWNEKHIQYVHARDTLDTATKNFCKGAYTIAQADLEEVLNEKTVLEY